MTNPFNNPFGTPAREPGPALGATAVPRPIGTVRKILGWVVLLFGALIVIAALVDWSEPGMSVGMTFFGAAFVLTGATLVWQLLPWRIAGPTAGVLLVVCFAVVGATTAAQSDPQPAGLPAPSALTAS